MSRTAARASVGRDQRPSSRMLASPSRCRRQRCGFRIRGTIDDHQVSGLSSRLLEQARQPGGLGGYHGRGGLIAFVRPVRGRGLRIEIEQTGLHAPVFDRHRDTDADGLLTGTAPLADNGDRFHSCALIV